MNRRERPGRCSRPVSVLPRGTAKPGLFRGDGMTRRTSLSILARWLRRRAENVVVALLGTMFVCFIIQIFFRLHAQTNPVGWTEEGPGITTLALDHLCGARPSSLPRKEEGPLRHRLQRRGPKSVPARCFTVITGLALIFLYGISLPARVGSSSAFMKVERSAYLHIPAQTTSIRFYPIFAVACIGRYCSLVWRAGPPATLSPVHRARRADGLTMTFSPLRPLHPVDHVPGRPRACRSAHAMIVSSILYLLLAGPRSRQPRPSSF